MSYLITGGTAEARLNKTQEMAKRQFHASSFDTIIIGGETSIGIGQIRELEHRLNLKPYNSESKAAIIHPGEMLTLEAQNALLKTLEEPNISSIIILTAPQADFLLPTIVSRCQIIRLESKPEIKLTENDIVSLLHCFIVTLSNGVGERLKFASTVGKNKEEIKEWLTKMLFALHEILLTDSGHLPAPATTSKMLAGTLQAGARMTSLQIVEIIRNLEKTRSLIDQNINHKLALEIFLLDLPDVRS